MARASDIDGLLEDTVQPPRPRRPSRSPHRARRPAPVTPPLIAAWKQEQAAQKAGWWKRWVSSQVAGYRLDLIVYYLTVMFFGGSAIAAGIPVFSFTTPEGFTPIWAGAVVLAGFVAAAGATRAGEEPQTKTVKVFNRIELGGAIGLFLTLGTYAVILLIIGYGAFSAERLASGDTATQIANLGRAAVGAALLALTARPAVRMVWLFFHHGDAVPVKPVPIETRVTDVDTGETGIGT